MFAGTPVSSSNIYEEDPSTGATYVCSFTWPSGFVEINDVSDIDADCDDDAAAINPDATEECDGVDNDCDGTMDDGVTRTWYPDADADTFGDDSSSGTMSCDTTMDGYVENNTDCDDSVVTINPGETEVCNEIDDNCADGIDEGVELTFYLDSDTDGYGDAAMTDMACSAPPMYVANDDDCDDSDIFDNPGGTETCNGDDEDCDGIEDDGLLFVDYYTDGDLDGYGAGSATSACSMPSGMVVDNTDCNDASGTVHPGATETCNSTDDDCDGSTDEGVQTTFYLDSDSDGYGVSSTTSMACSTPIGYADVSTDCNDAAGSINPGASETCNSLDDDCDSSVDEGLATTVSYLDSDSDGYGDLANPHSAYCAVPSGYAASSTDCNDAVFAVNPGATDVANNGLDDNCDETALDEICTIPTFSSTSVYYQLWLDNLDTSTDDANWAYPGSARGRADEEVCAQNVTITVDEEWKVNGVFSTSATSGTFYSTSASFYAYGNGDTYVNFDYITVMGEEVEVTKTSWGGGADALFYVMEELPN